jgi:hypothetical protein
MLEPWLPLKDEERTGLERELTKEMRPDHVLSGADCRAVARRCDCDDILFETNSKRGSLVVVHLTWSGKPDQYPQWPSTRFFDSWEDFKEREMLPEHQAYTA